MADNHSNRNDRPIEVIFEPEGVGAALQMPDDGRPSLTWGKHPIHGNGWTLWHWDDPDAQWGLEEYFIPGDLTDIDAVVESAHRWLQKLDEEGEVDG